VTNPTPQQAASEGGDQLIVYGDSAQSEINDQVYAQFYQFEGAAGDQIAISADRVSGTLDPMVILRDANDDTLPQGINDDADDSTRNARLTYTLTADGEYIIAVTRYGVRDGTTAGIFRLTLELLNPAQ
jgi:hypothetical protein